ncbi:M24 family metallopeptidase [Nonomuraea rhizosphaerae]|uniref:M24 family metallopeptidase n=1 Tax=Nonomuraea rhizosphaerae TaxID=2665663 RepID=UPI001C5D0FF0|nr:Xaa-Pro peptidase family protein [Nonomuraea rhizosphaerae]
MTAPSLLHASRADDLMRAHDLDALVATSAENVTYASEFWSLSQWLRRRPQVYVVLPRDRIAEAVLIAPTNALDLLASTEPTWISDIRRYGASNFAHSPAPDSPAHAEHARVSTLLALPQQAGPATALAAALRDKGLDEGRIGIDESGMSPACLEELRQQLPKAAIVPADLHFRTIRAVKTPAEIDRLRRAAQITERAVEACFAEARAGVSERELATIFLNSLIRQDARPALTVLGGGPRSALPAAQPGERRLSPGDVLRLDAGCYYRNYRSDISRCAVLGTPSDRLRTAYGAILAGQQAGIEAIRPGVRADEVFAAAMRAARAGGLPGYHRTHVGHGIGIEGYDVPNLAEGDRTVLEEGMVLCVETPYYELGWAGIQVEDTVVVRAHGAETLMRTPRHLRVLG